MNHSLSMGAKYRRIGRNDHDSPVQHEHDIPTGLVGSICNGSSLPSSTRWQIPSGIVPKKLCEPRYNPVKFFNRANSVGIVPVKSFRDKSSSLRFIKFPRVDGIVPTMSLWFKTNRFNKNNLPIWLGIVAPSFWPPAMTRFVNCSKVARASGILPRIFSVRISTCVKPLFFSNDAFESVILAFLLISKNVFSEVNDENTSGKNPL
mmetsp:Transcript_11796/g.16864  ORF Transcript_11796/g.16864 Transcript_11796/m.16864 type:complete len:205 (-) Transcript_11796:899-1513(-)